MKKQILALALAMSLVSGVVMPRKADAVLLAATGVITGGIGTGLAFGFGSFFLASAMLADHSPGAAEAFIIGLVLNENGKQTVQAQPFDYASDLNQKVELGVYTGAQAEEIKTSITSLNQNQRLTTVELAGLNRAQAIEAIQGASGMNALAADYLLDLHGFAQ